MNELSLAGVSFKVKGLPPTILYRLTDLVPEKTEDGKAIFMVMPEYTAGHPAVSLFGPPPKSGRKVVLLHPNNYVRFCDLVAGRYVLQEWNPEAKNNGAGISAARP